MILKVMERIVRQEIPAAVDRQPRARRGVPRPTRSGRPAPRERVAAAPPPASRTRATRTLLDVFHAVREVDPYSPTAPTFIARRFELDRQIPETEVEALLESVLDLAGGRRTWRRRIADAPRPAAGAVRHLVHRLQVEERPLRGGARRDRPRQVPDGRGVPGRSARAPARPRLHRREGGMARRADRRRSRRAARVTRWAPCGARTRRTCARAIPARRHGLQGLQHRDPRARPQRRAGLLARTEIDHWFLSGVPNNAFTEALAFVFQERDLELLGLGAPGTDARRERGARRRCGPPTRSAASRSSTCGSGAGCTSTRTRRPPSCAQATLVDRARGLEPLLRPALRRRATRRSWRSTPT